MFTNSSAVNLRKEPSTDSEKVTTLTINIAVDVVSEKNGWSKVKVSGKEGYISSSLLSDKKQETSRNSTVRTSNTSTESNKNVNASSSISSANTQTASNETTSTASAAQTGNGSAVVERAKQYLGSRYVYGGMSPNGFDCSGFTSYIYKQFGVSLNRTAAGQYSNGTAVSRNNLQPGDLIMFGKSGINHVAIYAGNGTIVHAANPSRGVTTDTINSGYYNNNYVGARRVY